MKPITAINIQTRHRLIIAILTLIGVALYIGLSAAAGEAGFPLDDGWIHQTYARNLARTGNWECVPGQISAGSTAPLWTMLLAAGYLLKLPYTFWTYLLGWLSLVWLGWAAMALWRLLWPARRHYGWLAGAVLVLTWPMVWAAASGMETVLFAALGLQIVLLYTRIAIAGQKDEDHMDTGAGSFVNRIGNSIHNIPHPVLVLVLGFLTGLLILVRPDGLGLLILVAAGLFLTARTNRERIQNPAVFLLAALLPLLPYFAFNLSSSGTLWPNTFYAKQAEYAFLWERPLPLRFLQLLYHSLGGPAEGWRGISGVHLLLLPGLIWAAWRAVRHDWSQRRLLYTLPILWAAGHILLYAWRLPVTYQHGRYLWAAIPIWTLFGLAGWQDLSIMIQTRLARLQFIWRMVTMLTFALLLLGFLMIGAQVYTFDVGVINGEMVAAAHWIEANTPEDALIAAHDIGAIGYFAERPLLDLAGLISPEVIDLLADESRLSHYVIESSAGYLVTAPGWTYPTLTNSELTTLLFETNYEPTREQGFNNIAVYQINRP